MLGINQIQKNIMKGSNDNDTRKKSEILADLNSQNTDIIDEYTGIDDKKTRIKYHKQIKKLSNNIYLYNDNNDHNDNKDEIIN